jgi:hypothetical protein
LKKYSLDMLMAFMTFNALLFVITFVWFALELRLFTFLFALPFVIIYLIMFYKKSLKDREGAEEPEKLLKNPHFAFYTLFLVILFILTYLLR